ncbi:Z1 domain-containing protein [Spiroplasma endosymbiont of Cantharis lateralis]|uniref:Z1 domain-containing protein n=1 Tax=Spiroplasma endosymbiont of Cantharis lateralis TaxID=3066277 RepID=UPI00313B89C9
MNKVWEIDLNFFKKELKNNSTQLPKYIKSDLVNGIIEKLKVTNNFSNNYFENIVETNLKRIDNAINNIVNNKKGLLIFGKVQSGKTINTIFTTAMLFDKGYDIVILLCGTTNILKRQNSDRFEEFKFHFNDNGFIKMKTLSDKSIVSFIDDIGNRKFKSKLFIPILKEKTNLENLINIVSTSVFINKCKIAIIDDESDIASINYNFMEGEQEERKIPALIKDLLNKVDNSNYIAVTATPYNNIIFNRQINDEGIKIDYILGLENDLNYHGFNFFHQNKSRYIIEVKNNELKKNISLLIEIFKENYNSYINKKKNFSILINTSVSTTEHSKTNKILKKELEILSKELDLLRDNYSINIYNSKSEDEICFSKKFNFIIGGNLLSRGITFPNLVLELITNFNEEGFNPSTMIQRCRWFGYRDKVKEIIKILMPSDLSKFYSCMRNIENIFFKAIGNGIEVDNSFVEKLAREFEGEGIKWNA